MPLARATSPSARRKKSGSFVSSTAVMYSAIASSSSVATWIQSVKRPVVRCGLGASYGLAFKRMTTAVCKQAFCRNSRSAFCVDRAWPEDGAAPALMPGYQRSLGRRTVLGPGESVCLFTQRTRTTATGKALVGPRAQRMGAAEHRRLWVGVRTRTLRQPIRRVCLNETNAVSAGSYAARPRVEEHRGPVAQRRASLCAVPAARPKPCKHATQRRRTADAGKQPQWPFADRHFYPFEREPVSQRRAGRLGLAVGCAIRPHDF